MNKGFPPIMGILLVEILVGIMSQLAQTLSFYFFVGVSMILVLHHTDKITAQLPPPYDVITSFGIILVVIFACAISWQLVANRGRG